MSYLHAGQGNGSPYEATTIFLIVYVGSFSYRIRDDLDRYWCKDLLAEEKRVPI